MRVHRLTLLVMAAAACLSVQAQQREIFSTGLVDDREAISQMPMKKELLTRNFQNLPSSVSLLQYCPRPGSQSFHGKSAYATCTAWATTYAAMTIMEAVRWGWTDPDVITNEAFAPLFVYAKTKFKGDDDCNLGVGLYTALPFLKNEGAPKHRNYNSPCDENVPRWVADEAADHKIKDYVKLFDDPYPCSDPEKKVRITKKSIAEKKPVVIAMDVPKSFDKAGEVWEGGHEEGERLGKHSMCVVGYDDEKAGGAFLVMNSWGESWGKDGFTWVRYSDYQRYVNYAFELFAGNESRPVTVTPQPAPQQDAILPVVIDDEQEKDLAGSMRIELSTSETLAVRQSGSKPCPVYRVSGKFVIGSRFRIYLTNNAPAYVYVIGDDADNNVDPVFPPDNSISPALTYSQSDIALPREDYWIEMDGRSNRNYLCILYATHALPMDRIMDFVKQNDGDIEHKLVSALDTLCPGERVQPQDIKSERDRIDFRATTTGNIVPLIVEIREK